MYSGKEWYQRDLESNSRRGSLLLGAEALVSQHLATLADGLSMKISIWLGKMKGENSHR